MLLSGTPLCLRLPLSNLTLRPLSTLPLLPNSFHSPLSNRSSSSKLPLLVQNNPIWYICGPTVYAPPHLGHARCYITLDFYRRMQQFTTGKTVKLAINVTDIDDKLITASESSGVSVKALASRFEEEFFKALKNCNVLPPSRILRVTESIPEIVEYIQKLVDNNVAYIVQGEGIYFSISNFENLSNPNRNSKKVNKYGKLGLGQTKDLKADSSEDSSESESNAETETLFEWTSSPSTSRSTSKKHNPRDFALWKTSSSPTTHLTNTFPSPWGYGRPGWHIECNAMILKFENEVGGRVDHHGGGVDLKFPHHTNEIVQADGYYLNDVNANTNENSNDTDDDTDEWIDNWIHPGHLYIKGSKMSKSLKNFITCDDLQDSLITKSTLTQTSAILQAQRIRIKASQLKLTPKDVGDIYRLWVLGFSGSLTGHANFRIERMEEAGLVRCEIVDFVYSGHSANNDDGGAGGGVTGWSEKEIELTSVLNSTERSILSIVQSTDKYKDKTLESSPILKAIMSLVKECKAYTTSNSNSNSNSNVNVELLDSCRVLVVKYLSVLGFSSGMCERDVMQLRLDALYNSNGNSNGNGNNSEDSDGTTLSKSDSDNDSDEDKASININTILSKLNTFRSSVRNTCLKTPGKKSPGEIELLKLCDDLRSDLNGLGIDCVDTKVVQENNGSDSDNDGDSGSDVKREKKATERRIAKSYDKATQSSMKKFKTPIAKKQQQQPQQQQRQIQQPAVEKSRYASDHMNTFPTPTTPSSWSTSPKPLPKKLFRDHPLYTGIFGQFDSTGLPVKYVNGGGVSGLDGEVLRRLKGEYVEWFYFGDAGGSRDCSKSNEW